MKEINNLNEIFILNKNSEYKKIPNYEGYMISILGDIISSREGLFKDMKPCISNKYITFGLIKDGKEIREYLHRLMCITFIGDIPDGMVVDHIDRDMRNNNINNLRLVTKSQNMINSNKYEYSNGYSYYKKSNKWRARIRMDGKEKHIGLFNTEEEARQAYLNERNKIHVMPE